MFSSYLGFWSETMLNLPDSLYPDPIQGDNSVMSNGGAPANNNGPCDGASKAIDWPSASVEDLVVLLREPEHREKAISSLTQIKVHYFSSFMKIFVCFMYIFVCLCMLLGGNKLICNCKFINDVFNT